MLYIFGGLPGTGKSTLARALACEKRAVWLRIDTIEQGLRAAEGHIDGPEGYIIAYRSAEENLRLGLSVVAGSVNPLATTRTTWRAVAVRTGVPSVEIEAVCSRAAEHRHCVESRRSDIPGAPLPTWEEVVTREVEPWPSAQIVVDTAGQSPSESVASLRQALASLV